MSTSKSGGLEGIVVADTRLSEVDGERGRLIVVGHDIEDLTGRVPFEELCQRLWHQDPAPGAAAISADLGRARLWAFEKLGRLGDALDQTDGMDALRAAAAHLPLADAGLPEEIAVTGALAVFGAAWARRRGGGTPVPPDPTLSHAADVLRMVLGAPAPAPLSAGLDSYLVTVADHGMNASTFTARVVASTGSDLVSAVVAAIGALKGPLHGGAPGPVLDMLDAISEPARATEWLEAEILAGRRIMGMGHRIYRVRDPRALVLERTIEALEQAGRRTGRLALARAVESAAEGVLKRRHPDRPLSANVEFYTAVLLDTLGFHRAFFTPLFAIGRVAGWCAHVREQRDGGRLIRPASRYVGPMPQSV